VSVRNATRRRWQRTSNSIRGWKSLVDLMASKGADATDAELDEIVHYLANRSRLPNSSLEAAGRPAR